MAGGVVALAAIGLLAVSCVSGAPEQQARPAPDMAARAAAPSSFVAAGTRLGVGGCPLFPRDHAFHADVTHLPVARDSAAMIAAAGGTATSFWPGFSAGVWEGSRAGIPVNVIDPAATTPTDFAVASIYAAQSQPQGVPLPAAPRFEGWPGRAWDRHLLLVDPAACTSRELINVQLPGENLFASGSWYADSVVSVNLSSNAALPAAVTASGLSLLSGMVRYDEVASGDVGHAVAVALPMVRDTFVWPARHTDGRTSDPAAPPMGSWFRLRPDADLSGLGPQARVVARAMQLHGAVLVDTGPRLTMGGEPDVRWDDKDLKTLSTLDMGDLDVVDPAPMQVDPATLQIR